MAEGRVAVALLSSYTCSSLLAAALWLPNTCGRVPLEWLADRADTCCTPWCTPLFPEHTIAEDTTIQTNSRRTSSLYLAIQMPRRRQKLSEKIIKQLNPCRIRSKRRLPQYRSAALWHSQTCHLVESAKQMMMKNKKIK